IHRARIGVGRRPSLPTHTALVVQREPTSTLEALKRVGWSAEHVTRLGDALEALGQQEFTAVVTETDLPDAHGRDVVSTLAVMAPRTPVVVAGDSDWEGAMGHIADPGDPRLLLRTLDDAIARKRSERRLARPAPTERSTGLATRATFLDRVDTTVRGSLARGHLAAVLVVVVEGEAEAVADHLKSHLRVGDEIGRLGRDELGVVLGDLRSAEEAGVVAARIRDQLAGLEADVTLGLAVARDPGSTEELLRRASAARYAEATAGGVPVWHEPLDPAKDLVLSALERGELRFHYQGQYRQERLVCLEALLRWHHPRLGVLTPGAFLPRIEGTEAMTTIGRRTLDWTLADLARLRALGAADVRMAFNMTPRQLEDATLVERVSRTLARHGLCGEALEIEITEHVLTHDSQHLLRTLGGLRDAGVRIALDDFGAGYSALTYLTHLPLDVLKLDGSLVEGLGTPSGRVVVETVVGLGHRLGLEVVAECVETDEQRDMLATMGVDRLQGYLLGRPEPIDSWVTAAHEELEAVAG
ncbi:MAG: EAL domain-containing protein, partial [Myxococcales bacterium]|nr:EAL domain-containing protein [Myxococcales bacterium]